MSTLCSLVFSDSAPRALSTEREQNLDMTFRRQLHHSSRCTKCWTLKCWTLKCSLVVCANKTLRQTLLAQPRNDQIQLHAKQINKAFWLRCFSFCSRTVVQWYLMYALPAGVASRRSNSSTVVNLLNAQERKKHEAQQTKHHGLDMHSNGYRTFFQSIKAHVPAGKEKQRDHHRDHRNDTTIGSCDKVV